MGKARQGKARQGNARLRVRQPGRADRQSPRGARGACSRRAQDSDGFADFTAAIDQIGVVAHGQPFRLADGGHRQADGIGLTGRQGRIEREQWRVVLAGHTGDLACGRAGGELPVQLPHTTGSGQCTDCGIGVGQVIQFSTRQGARQFPVRNLHRHDLCRRQRLQCRLIDDGWRRGEHCVIQPEHILHRFDAPLR